MPCQETPYSMASATSWKKLSSQTIVCATVFESEFCLRQFVRGASPKPASVEATHSQKFSASLVAIPCAHRVPLPSSPYWCKISPARVPREVRCPHTPLELQGSASRTPPCRSLSWCSWVQNPFPATGVSHPQNPCRAPLCWPSCSPPEALLAFNFGTSAPASPLKRCDAHGMHT